MADTPETPPVLVDVLAAAVERATGGAWRAARITQERGHLRVPVAPAGLIVEVRLAAQGARSYREVSGYSFAYRSDGRALSETVRAALDQTIEGLADVLAAAAFNPNIDLLRPSAARAVGFPTPYQFAHLYEEVGLLPKQVDDYRRDGHLLVRRAINPDVVRAAVPTLSKALERNWPQGQRDVPGRPDAYSQGFTQITDLGATNPLVRVFSNLRRISSMAAQLMGVQGVRLFCEDWLIKEPGAGITPWHQDRAAFPFDAQATITAWIPLRNIAPGEGLLRFARGTHRFELAGAIEGLNEDSEAGYARIIQEAGAVIDEMPAVFLGDVSFHDGGMIHGAFPNPGSEHRAALALHCFADGATIKHITTPAMQLTLASAAPHLSAGDLARCDAWPLVYGDEAPAPQRIELVGSGPGPTRIHAVLLPTGEPRAIVIERGLLRIEPISGTEAPPDVFACSGLVECHGHISYPHTPEDPVSELRWMNPNLAAYAETGVTLIRDMGATDDGICRLLDVPGLPRVQASGLMMLRSDAWPLTRTDPDQLVEACLARVQAGARWVKVFADFTDDYRGRVDPGFTESDAVSYPLEILRAAVDAVHELGGRMAAHCFTHAGTQVAVEAGVDSLEHGWGVDEALLDRMAERGTAWAPLVGITRSMWDIAERDGHADRHDWLRRIMADLSRTLPLAEQRGVTLLAGTDRFPTLTVADEIIQMCALGVSRVGALAAGCWAAREYLREPGLRDGAPADVVVYPRDPRLDLTVLNEPEVIFVSGKRVEPCLAGVRPSFEAFWPPPAHTR